MPSFLHPNDTWVILRGETACDRDPCFEIVDLETGKMVMRLPHSDEDTYYGTPVPCFDPSGRFAVLAYEGTHHSSFRAWDLQKSCAQSAINPPPGKCLPFDLPAPGGQVQFPGEDAAFDLATGNSIQARQASDAPRTFAISGRLEKLPRWLKGVVMAPERGELVWDYPERLRTTLRRANRHLLVWSGFSTVREIDPRSGAVLRCISATMPHVALMAFGRSRHELITARANDQPWLWNRLGKDTFLAAKDLQPEGRPPVKRIGPHAADPERVTETPTPGSRALASSSAGVAWGDDAGNVWMARGAASDPKAWSKLGTHGEAVRTMAFVPDRPWLLTGARDGSLCLWDHETRASLARLPDTPSRINSIAVHRSDLSLSAGPDGIRLWNLRTRVLLRHLETQGAWVSQAAFSPDGTWVGAALLDGTLRLWEVASGRLVWSAQGGNGWCAALAFHPNGRDLVAGYESGALIRWACADGSRQSTHPLKTITAWSDRVFPIHGLAWSPDGETLAVAQGDGIRVLHADLSAGRGPGWVLPLDWADGYT